MLSVYYVAVFLTLYLKLCDGSGNIVYVIDNTASMKKVGRQILSHIREGQSNILKNIVLVTFNGRDVRLRPQAENESKFNEVLRSILFYDGGKCPENSLSGIIKGLEKSSEDSYMYVFTDAPAEDYDKREKVKELCMEKRTQINFILTGNCGDPSSKEFRVYYDIAQNCYGRVILINPTDVNKILSLNMKNARITPVPFKLDENTDFATINASRDVNDIVVTREDFGKPKVQRLNWRQNVKWLNVSAPGNYVAWVAGNGKASVTLYYKTNFRFLYGFSEGGSNSLADTSSRPIADKNQQLLIYVSDYDQRIRIERINILSITNKVLMSKPLKRVRDYLYTTDFVCPKSSFILQVIGTDKQRGTSVYRNTETIIEPIEPIQKDPPSINTSLNFANKTLTALCLANGTPEPTISWYYGKNRKEFSKLDVTGEELKIDNVNYHRTGYYRCLAENAFGTSDANFYLRVDKTMAQVGESVLNLGCQYNGQDPEVTIVWKNSVNEIITSDIKYDLKQISNGLYLSIKNPSTNDSGYFICEVNSDDGNSVFISEIRVTDPPRIAASQYLSGKTLTALCLVKGTPKPTVSWYYGEHVEDQRKLDFAGEELKIDNVHYNRTGYYGCLAENAFGTSNASFYLQVDEILNRANVGDSVLELGCEYNGQDPEVTLVWKNSDNEVITSDFKYQVKKISNALYLYIKDPSTSDTGYFICEVNANDGNSVFISETKVTDPITITATQHFSNKTLTASCLVKGTPKPTVSWYYGENIEELSKLDVTGEELTIDNVNYNRTGYYGCLAENIFGTNRSSFYLHVDKIPHMAKVGDSVLKLGCEYNGQDPDVTLVWKNSDNEVITSDFKYEVKKISNALYLHIKDPSTSDTGFFICEVNANDGNSVFISETKVTDPVTIAVTQHFFNKTLTASCLVKGTPKPTVSWYYGENIEELSKLDVTGEELTIDNVNYNRTGYYGCLAENIFGTNRSSFYLHVDKIPHMAKVGDSVLKLGCEYNGQDPDVTLVWKNSDNEVITSDFKYEVKKISNALYLHIKDPSTSDTGFFICEVNANDGNSVFISETKVTDPVTIAVTHHFFNKTLTASCLVKGTPKPTVSWYYGENIEELSKLDVTGEELTIDNVNYNRTGYYGCLAENIFGTNRSSFYLHVDKIPHMAKVGDSVLELGCGYNGQDPDVTLVWKNSDNVVITSDFKYDVKKISNALYLHIKDPSTSDTGYFICEVNANDGNSVFISETNVTDPITIAATQHFSNIILTASCLAKGTPKPSVTWYYQKVREEHFKQLNVTGEYLVINNFKQNYGCFECVAENAVRKEVASFCLHANKYDFPLKALVGDLDLELVCERNQNPEMKYVWKNSNSKIITADSKYNVHENHGDLYLSIKNPSLNDTDYFICEVSNAERNTYLISETFVTDNFQNDKSFYGGNMFYTFINENDSKELECTGMHLNSSKRWYKNGVLTDVIGKYYLIKNASDDGNYTCRFNLEHGSLSETYIVKVGSKPMFANVDSTMQWLGDDSDFVDCSLKPLKPLDTHTEVEWTYNGIKTNVKIYQHPVYGWGQYTCKVSNVFGNIEKSINVTFDGCLIKKKIDLNNNNPPLLLSFNTDFESDQPMYFDGINNYTILDIGQKIKISCHNQHDKNNFKIYPDEEFLIAECLKEDKFVVNGETYKYSDIKCEKSVEVLIDSTNWTCTHDRSELINVGFGVNLDGFIRIYSVCFDNKLKVPIFAYNVISLNNLGNQVDYNKWVNISNYQGVISTDCEKESKCCYGKEQLLNAVDVTFGPPQAATFYDYNAVGVWKPCENESRISWQMIEENVRNVLKSLGYKLKIWSGASGYEQQNIGMVPRYLWKVIDSLGVIVYVNDPHPTEKEIKCSATIKTLDRVINAKDQFTYLCSIDEFSNTFNIPRSTFEQIL